MKNHLIILVHDYHEFDDYKDNFKLNGINYKYEECGCGYTNDYYPRGAQGKYHAVFYLERTKEVKDLIAKLIKELE